MTNQEITQNAIDEVRDNNIDYYNDLLIFTYGWVRTKFKSFSSEDLKNDYFALGNDEPFEMRVFGAVFRKLSKEKLIFKNGFELSKNPKCHQRPQQMWISLEMSLKQQSNATKDKNQISIF